ncbi:hypothetical protein [Nocardia salmonicida]|uniref:hypothetical protein n=1 Tax=Nocardia salmonicida TaxID=53431 RepID=UPI0037889CCE
MSVDDWYGNRAHRHDRDPGYDPVNDDVRDPFEFGAVQEIRFPAREQRPSASGMTGRAQPSSTGLGVPARRKGSGKRRGKSPEPVLDARKQKRWKVFANEWFARNPQGKAQLCRDEAQAAGLGYVTLRMASEQRLRAAQSKRRRPVDPARRVMRSPDRIVADIASVDPDTSLEEYQQALLAAGHPFHDRAAIAGIFQRLTGRKRRHNPRRPSPTKRIVPAVTSRAVRQPMPQRVLRSAVEVTDSRRCPSCEVVPDPVTGSCRCG